jgi:hypothetical protein
MYLGTQAKRDIATLHNHARPKAFDVASFSHTTVVPLSTSKHLSNPRKNSWRLPSSFNNGAGMFISEVSDDVGGHQRDLPQLHRARADASMVDFSGGINSSSNANALSSALAEFQASLSDERKARLMALRSMPGAAEVLAFTAELDRANAARKRRGVASRFCTLLESIQQYATVMDTYSQVKADTTSLVWGTVKLSIHVRCPSIPIHCAAPIYAAS